MRLILINIIILPLLFQHLRAADSETGWRTVMKNVRESWDAGTKSRGSSLDFYREWKKGDNYYRANCCEAKPSSWFFSQKSAFIEIASILSVQSSPYYSVQYVYFINIMKSTKTLVFICANDAIIPGWKQLCLWVAFAKRKSKYTL